MKRGIIVFIVVLIIAILTYFWLLESAQTADSAAAPEEPMTKGPEVSMERTPRNREESPAGGILGFREDFQQQDDEPMFLWPPPKPSVYTEIPLSALTEDSVNLENLDDLNSLIRDALERGEYYDTGYYGIPEQPDGFVLVTRLEKIEVDGSPVALSERWVTEVDQQVDFNLSRYLKSLFVADEGFYRVIAFVVTSQDITSWGETVSAKVFEKMISEANPSLMNSTAKQSVTDTHTIYALIYEFAKGCEDCNSETQVKQLIPGKIQSRTHLYKANIWRDEKD